MDRVLNWPYFRNRAIVASFRFGWMIVIMWDGMRTQFHQGRVEQPAVLVKIRAASRVSMCRIPEHKGKFYPERTNHDQQTSYG